MAAPLEQRFWSKVDKRGPDECWPWTASLVTNGYGNFKRATRKPARSHRVSWELANGRPVPEGMLVCHRCDNPKCVNPAHLFIGTSRDNTHDMVRKGRARKSANATHCKYGHEWTPENTLRHGKDGGGHRYCRECHRIYKRRAYHAARAEQVTT